MAEYCAKHDKVFREQETCLGCETEKAADNVIVIPQNEAQTSTPETPGQSGALIPSELKETIDGFGAVHQALADEISKLETTLTALENRIAEIDAKLSAPAPAPAPVTEPAAPEQQ
jgi:hypothetical protein